MFNSKVVLSSQQYGLIHEKYEKDADKRIKKGLSENLEEYNERGPSAQSRRQEWGLAVPPARWAQHPPPRQAAAGLKEL